MDKIRVDLLKDVNGVEFGSSRQITRKKFGKKFKEIKKNQFSQNTMDAYKDYHIYYDENNCFEAIEFFSGAKVEVSGTIVFPGNVEELSGVVPGIIKDEYGYTSLSHSVGVSTDDNGKIESILFGKEGYYED